MWAIVYLKVKETDTVKQLLLPALEGPDGAVSLLNCSRTNIDRFALGQV